jgi:hypothetical protein
MLTKILSCLAVIFFITACQNDKSTDSTKPDDHPDTTAAAVWVAHDTIRKNGISVAMAEKKGGLMGQVKISMSDDKSQKAAKKNFAYDGIFHGAHLYDLNNDGKMEVYIFNSSEGTGSYGDIIAYQYDQGKMDSIRVDNSQLMSDTGYMGHDSIYINPPYLYRQYPVYHEEDPNCCPTGGKRRIKYKLTTVKGKLTLIPLK